MTNSQKEINFSLIIPNYNGSKFILNCLESIYSAIKNCPDSQFEIIIVDNASTDNSCQIAKNFFDKHKIKNLSSARPTGESTIYYLTSNQGFASAVNYGINHSQYQYVCLVNNDLTISPNWFQLISQSISKNTNPKVATFFGTVLNQDGTKFESQGLQFFIRGKCLNISNNQPFNKSKILNLRSKIFTWGASAALVVYQKDILQKIGLFDDDFFAYLEDVDINIRLNKLNYKTIYIPKAISLHIGGGTSRHMTNFRYRMDVKNWIYIIIKNYSAKDFWGNFFPIFNERLRNLSGLIKNTIRIYRVKSIWILPKDLIKTYGEILIKLPKMLQKRHQIQKIIKCTS